MIETDYKVFSHNYDHVYSHDFSDASVKDWVVIQVTHHGFGKRDTFSIRPITHITDKQFTAGNIRFHKDRGDRVGMRSNTWRTGARAYPYTAEFRHALRAAQRRAVLLDAASGPAGSGITIIDLVRQRPTNDWLAKLIDLQIAVTDHVKNIDTQSEY